jgi:hypothetical protein
LKASVCFLRKFVNKTFIVQNCAKIPTKKQNKNTKESSEGKIGSCDLLSLEVYCREEAY